MAPGDEVAPGTLGAGENVCPTCNGGGKVKGATCGTCGGTAVVIEEVVGPGPGAWRGPSLGEGTPQPHRPLLGPLLGG